MTGKWKNLKMWQQMLIIFAAVGVIVAVVIGMKPDTSAILYSNLNPNEVIEIEQELSKLGISSTVGEDGTMISIDNLEIPRAKAHLATLGLPSSGDPGFELLDENSIGSTKFDKEKRYERALVGDIQQGLVQGFGFVEKAIVQLNFTMTDSIFEEESESKASVTIHVANSKSLTESQVQAIKNFVASSVKNLDTASVDVMDKNGVVYDLEEGNLQSAGGYGKQMQIVDQTETRIRNDIMRMLAQNFGSENVTLVVRANINFDEIVRNIEKYDPEGTLMSRQESNETVTKNDGVTVQEPGTDTNGTVPDYELDEAQTTVVLNQEKNEIIENFEVGKTVETIKENPELTDIRVTATINESVDADMVQAFITEWEEIIANAAGIQVNEDGTFENGHVKVSPQVYAMSNADVDDAQEVVVNAESKKMKMMLVILGAFLLVLLAIIAWFIQKRKNEKEYERMVLKKKEEAKINAQKIQTEPANGMSEQERTDQLMKEIDRQKAISQEEAVSQEQEALANQVREFAEENPARTADYIKKLISEG